jgi:hypothetical protein
MVVLDVGPRQARMQNIKFLLKLHLYNTKEFIKNIALTHLGFKQNFSIIRAA